MIEEAEARRRSTHAGRAVRYLLFAIATVLKVVLILLLYAVIVLAAFAFAIGIFDSIRAGHDIPSVWPELHIVAAYFPGGLSLGPFVVMVLAYGATRLLDRAVDSLRPD